MTLVEFMRRFPDNDACLDYLREQHFPDGSNCPGCGRPTRFYRIKGRSAYSCQFCAHHVYPTAGTIFHKSSTSLQLWFWGIYLVGSSKCGISAKQLEREIGVTYKTAWRMLHQIRSLLDEAAEPLTGEVEVDETFIGGKLRNSDRRRAAQAAVSPHSPTIKKREIVVAAVQRKGEVRATVVPDRTQDTLRSTMREFVMPESLIFTDELPLYVGIGREYLSHRRINHSARIYVESDGATTNGVESFFALFKNSVRGAHHSISAKYLPAYLAEYTFRWNHRKDATPLFWTILDRVERRDGLGVA